MGIRTGFAYLFRSSSFPISTRIVAYPGIYVTPKSSVYVVANKCSLLTVTSTEQRTIMGGGSGVDFIITGGLNGTGVSSGSGLGLSSGNLVVGGGGGFFRIPFMGACDLGIALAGGFFKAGVFLGYSGRSLDARGRLSRGGSLFVAACLLVTIITLY